MVSDLQIRLEEMDWLIRPNRRTSLRDIEVSCYGEDMIMIDHPVLPAPLPVGPKDDDFWEQPDWVRVRIIARYLENLITHHEGSPEAWLWLWRDLSVVFEVVDR